MSDPRIALVAEGETDYVVIQAALKAILRRPFLLDLLQPEPSRPKLGSGWGGVFKWCQEFRRRKSATIEADATLRDYDLVIVHLDADVADKAYADCGQAIADAAADLHALPCSLPCPPPSDTVAVMEKVLLSWLGIRATGPKSLFCIPSKATEAWLAAAIPGTHALLPGLECNPNVEARLGALPKAARVRKSVRVYKGLAGTVTAEWERVMRQCAQAALFDQRVRGVKSIFSTPAGSAPPQV